MTRPTVVARAPAAAHDIGEAVAATDPPTLRKLFNDVQSFNYLFLALPNVLD